MFCNVQDYNFSFRFAALAALTAFCCSVHAAELRVGEATTPPGTVVSVQLTVAGAARAVGAQFDVSYNPAAVGWSGVTPGDGLSGHIVDHEALDTGLRRVLVYSPTNATLAPGALVWVSFSVPTNAPDGDVPVSLLGTILAQVDGYRVQPLVEADGAVTVWSGGSFLALTQEGGGLRVWFQGIKARRYVFEASTNLTDWVVIGTNTVQDGTASIMEPDLRVFPQRFYRTRLLP